MTYQLFLSLLDKIVENFLEESICVDCFAPSDLLRVIAYSNLWCQAQVLLQTLHHLLPLVLGYLIPIILDRIIRTAREEVSHFWPTLLCVDSEDQKGPFLLSRPWASLQERVQLIVPALSALLTGPLGEVLSYLGPIARSFVTDELDQELVGLLIPRLSLLTYCFHL